jgi:hypothetical protein
MDLNSLKHTYNYRVLEGKDDRQKDAHFCWMCSSFLASADVTEVPTSETYSNSDGTNVRYNTYKHFREENLKVMD